MDSSNGVPGPLHPPSLRSPVSLLRGHKGAVICCQAHPSDDSLLTSGSEDGTAAIFDIRTLSKQLHFESQFDGLPVAAVSFLPRKEHLLAAAAGPTIFLLDMRMGGSGNPLHRFKVNIDEIGAISVDGKGDFLAAADDSGQIKVVNLNSLQLHKTLRGLHTNICTSVQFHPKKQWHMLSAGLDCQLARWDYSTGRTLQSWDFGKGALYSASDQNQKGGARESPAPLTVGRLCNPPLVHSIAVCSASDAFTGCCSDIGATPSSSSPMSGTLVAVARGDASVVVLDADVDRRKGMKGGAKSYRSPFHSPAVLGPELGGHTTSVSHVTFLGLGSERPVVASGGNDRRIALWDLTRVSQVHNEAEAEEATLHEGSSAVQAKISAPQEGSWKKEQAEGRDEGSGGRSQQLKEKGSSGENSSRSRKGLLMEVVMHRKKVNWMAPQGMSNLFVADTTRMISLYNFS